MNQCTVPAVMGVNTLWPNDSPDTNECGDGRTRVWDWLRAFVQRLEERLEELTVGPVQAMCEQIGSWSLPSEVSSVPWARRLARTQLAAWGLADLVEVTELLVSELVTNALSHARGPYRLTLSAADGLLRCEVEDADTTLPHLQHARPDDEHGRGMDLLDLLACCWGSELTPEGKTVWFELGAQVHA
ncbi:ATP-binding protein [Streptosporangium soli]|nr:ATP-binding protein [Streptosporangium sp. KLBMP 9127]